MFDSIEALGPAIIGIGLLFLGILGVVAYGDKDEKHPLPGNARAGVLFVSVLIIVTGLYFLNLWFDA